ncbi:MAG: glycosyl transferase [Candidatus Bathyarchaeota archaeon B63]|nr:MAG: glycosyl transferase [Candidatus Bathyarchaeota archaeon B63]
MWPLDLISSFLSQFSLWQILFLLFVPIVIDLPRTLGKAILLLSHALYSRLRKQKFRLRSLPLISVIVPAHNEEDIIERNVRCLLESDYPRKEIIVVDDGSTDRTYQILRRYSRRGMIKLIRREKASGMKARAVNLGLRLARGEIILIVDADTLLEVRSISNMVKRFADGRVGAVAGNVRVRNQRNLLTRLQAYEYIMAMEMGRRYQALLGLLLIIPGAFGAVRREIMRRVGEYDIDTMTEDFDLTVKIHKLRRREKFAQDAVAWTVVPETLRGLIGQRTRWDLGQMQTLRKHKNIFFRSRFGLVGLLGAPDMVFADIILTFLRFGWLVYTLIVNPLWAFQIILLVLTFYFLLELVHVSVACLLSSRKEDLINMMLAPIVVFIYRPFLFIVRLRAYIKGLMGETVRW